MEKKLYDTIGNEFAVMHQTRHSNMFGKPCLKLTARHFAHFIKIKWYSKLALNKYLKH